MTNEPYEIGGAMKDPVLQAIETAKWCDGAVLDPTIKTPTMTYIHGANKQIEAIRSAYIAERQRLEQRIAELEAQLPKVVKPYMIANHWKCECGAPLYPGKTHPSTKLKELLTRWLPKYCLDCGAKLNWSEE